MASHRTIPMNHFQQKLTEHQMPLTRGRFETLQINVGRKCNQVCTHCHVDAGPHRTEMMTEEVAHKVGAWIREHRPKIVDITGGAPEISKFFRYFVETAREVGAHVIDRNNLTANHCLGCTAGHGSSCTGALAEPATHKVLQAC